MLVRVGLAGASNRLMELPMQAGSDRAACARGPLAHDGAIGPEECSAETHEIADYYNRLVTRLGPDPRALDWGSRASQHKRFEVLAQVGDLAGASVLDVGCGVGHLYDFLTSRDLRIDYTGYDIAPAVVEAARRRLPHVEIQMLDIVATDVDRAQFDFVVASGLFSLRRMRPYAYVEAVAHRMYALCRRGVALNCLSSRSDRSVTIAHGRFLADPVRVLGMCLDLTPNVVLRHDYMPHDFTVYLYKE